jgi:hypothetical protein
MQIKGSKYTIFGTHHKPLLFLKRFIADEVTTDILLVNKITHTHTHTHTHTYIYISCDSAILIYKLSKPSGNTNIRIHLSIMIIICNLAVGIHMFCSIQTYRHIGTSSMKFHINHSMHLSYNYIYMLCSIQIHIDMSTSSHENHPKICHKSSSCHACLSFVFIVS